MFAILSSLCGILFSVYRRYPGTAGRGMPEAGERHRPDLPGETQPGMSEPPPLREQGPQEVSE